MEGTSGEAGSAKRVKRELETTSIMQEGVQEDDVVVESPFTVAEMWALVPGHIRDEVFDHVDLRQATRLIRVSTSWQEELKKISERSKGIAVLKNWTTAAVRQEFVTTAGQDWGEEGPERPQIFSAIPKFVPVTHLILMDHIDTFKYTRHHEYEFSKRMLPTLRKITLGEPFTGSVSKVVALVGLLSPSLDELIIFPKWRLTVNIKFKLDKPTKWIKRIFQAQADPDAVQDDDEISVLFGSMGLDCPYFKLGTVSITENWCELTKRVWRLLDPQHMLWPYPNEQIEWLLASLSNLTGDALETVKLLDEDWILNGFWNGFAHSGIMLDKRTVTSEATANGRRLNSLDLAFLGRLLVFLDKYEKIPAQEPPPFPFSTELEIWNSSE